MIVLRMTWPREVIPAPSCFLDPDREHDEGYAGMVAKGMGSSVDNGIILEKAVVEFGNTTVGDEGNAKG